MPGIRISSDQDFSSVSVGRADGLTEFRTGLVGEYQFGRNRASSIPNSANADRPLTPYGAPTFGARSFTSSILNWFDTEITTGDNFTAAVVCQKGTGFQQIIGGYGGNSTNPSWALFVSSGLMFAQFDPTSGSGEQTDPYSLTGGDTDFRMLAIRCTGSVNPVIKVDEFRSNARQGGTSETFTGKTRKPVAFPVAIGSHRGVEGFPGAGAQGNTFASAFLWNVAMSDADLLAMYQAERTRLGALSSPIVC